ncbi:MAG: 2-oxoglutarate dehydrogenase E2 component (dihydrolipoamide succinyltransferase) [Sphingobacteriales bacterium]|jgi:2-oxoglutarate dehydrogenase E2 component (dihydrolipoamide succinyltransferase)
MARHELIMPKMGESVAEATIINWLKEVGETIEIDEPVLEIATDKVDSEVPSPVEGKLVEILFQVDDVVQVGQVVAVIETESEGSGTTSAPAAPASAEKIETQVAAAANTASAPKAEIVNGDGTRFYSPLVRSIASEEGIELAELEAVPGSGQDGRVTKQDILDYLKNRGNAAPVAAKSAPAATKSAPPTAAPSGPVVASQPGDEIIEMDRMRKLIADHMIMSKRVSPHVTSFVEADVTNLVNWRNKVKNEFLKKEGEKITFTPIFIEAVAKAIRDFPMINVAVDGTNIVKRKDINVGMAAALPSGNLIVPVIKNADQLNLVGLTKKVNDLANRARQNKLKPEDIQGGTYTISNVGTFGNVMGTPIINQPQVAILAVGAIKKKPVVLETPSGDVIAIRHMMFLSHSYDHRVVDGALGGMFVRKVADYLEQFDPNREI